jgi:hypothetical protein
VVAIESNNATMNQSLHLLEDEIFGLGDEVLDWGYAACCHPLTFLSQASIRFQLAPGSGSCVGRFASASGIDPALRLK